MKAVEGWNQISIGEFVDLINGFAFPSEGFNEGEGKPLIRIRDLERQKTDVNFRGKYNDCYIVKKDDLLIGMDGDFQTVKWKGCDALLNQRVCKLITKSPKVLVQDFLFYRIIEEILHIHRITAATTVKHLSSKDVLGIKIDIPSKPEQTKIAEILSTVDRAIEQTEAIIAKQQRIKTGLMHYLLTRGIDEHGSIRSEETHEFKDSPLGRIPVEWEVVGLGKISETITKGTTPTTYRHNYIETGISFFRVENITESGHINLNEIKFISSEANEFLNRSKLEEGDVLFSIAGAIGRCALVSSDILPANINQAISLIRFKNREQLNLKFILQMLLSINVKRQIELEATSLAQTNLNLEQVKNLKLPILPLPEQHRIAEILTAADNRIEKEKAYQNKLRSIKTALMQDLLTGKKRVTALLRDTGVVHG